MSGSPGHSGLPVANGVHSPRSASDPDASYSPAGERRSPLLSPGDVEAAPPRKETLSTLPSMRSLRNAFSSFGGGGKKAKQQQAPPPKVATAGEQSAAAPSTAPAPPADASAGKSPGSRFGFGPRKAAGLELPFHASLHGSALHFSFAPNSPASATTTSPRPSRSESPLPPIPVQPPSPQALPIPQLPPTLPLSPTPKSSNPKLRHRISSDFLRSPDDLPLAKLREGDARSQSLSRRSKRASRRLSAPVQGRPSQEDKRGRHVSASANLFSSSKRAKLADDLAYRRHSISSSPLLNGGGPELDKARTGWQRKTDGVGWEKPQGGPAAAGVGLGVLSEAGPSHPVSARKNSPPFPSDFEPVPIQHTELPEPVPRQTSGDGTRMLRPISIPATPNRLSVASSLRTLQKRHSSTGSRPRSLAGSLDSRSPSVRSPSPNPTRVKVRSSSNRSSSADPHLPIASWQSPDDTDGQQEEILEITAAYSRRSSSVDAAADEQEAEQSRSKSALESAREHGETTGQVGSGSPVFVIPSDAFVDAETIGRRRSSTSLRELRKASVDGGDIEVAKEWKEKKDRRRSLRGDKVKSEQWGVQLKQMLAAGDPNSAMFPVTNQAPLASSPVTSSLTPLKLHISDKLSGSPQRAAGPTSPLDDLISELGGRRPSDVSSVRGRPWLSLLESQHDSELERVPQPSVPEPSTVLAGASDASAYPSPLESRPPSAPPAGALPVTPIGEPEPAFAKALAGSPQSPSREEQPSDEEEDDDEDATEVIRGPDPDRTLTLDEMEREISRMEAELALGGRRLEKNDSPIPTSFSPAPSQTESSMTTPRVDDPQSAAFLAPPTPSSPDMTSLPLSSSPLDRRTSQSSSVNDITPRTARKWSIVEVERAYERMRGMLGSTKSFCLSDAGDVSVEEAFEQFMQRSQNDGTGMTLADVDDDVVMLLTPNRIPTTAPSSVRSASPSPARSHHDGLEPNLERSHPSPSLVVDAGPGGPKQPLTRASVDSLNSTSSASPTSLGYSPSVVSLKPSIDSLKPPSAASARAMRRRTFDVAPRTDSLRDVFDESHSTEARRRDSDNLTSRRAKRMSNRPAMSSSSAISEIGTSDDGWGTSAESPALTDHFGERTPAGARASSRLSNSGALRSGAGKDLQKWLADENRPESPGPSARVESRLSVQRLFSPEPTVGPDAGSTPKKRSSIRPLVLGTASARSDVEGSTWFPSTPDRQVHRKRSSLGRSTLSTTSATDSEPSPDARRASSNDSESGSMSIASIRGMDKLEIFFKYTSAKADLDKAMVERNALHDALQETRTTLTDVRAQRDGLEADLKDTRAALKQLRKFLGNDSDSYAEKLDELVQSRQLWEDRARDAVDELERSRDETDALRRDLVEGREREEQMEREMVMIGARLAAGEAYRASPSPYLASTVATAASSSPRSTLYMTSPRDESPKLNGHRTCGIPTHRRVGSAPASPDLARHRVQPSANLQQPASPITPASKLASAYRARTESNASSGSSVDRTEQNGLGVGETPLMGQTMTFGPKSSFGSVASPLKARSSPATTASSNGSPFHYKTTPPSARGQFNRLRLPAPPTGAHNRLSRMSTASSDFGGDHLPPPVERDWNPTATDVVPELREDDERFLRDLSVRDSYSGSEG